MVLPGFETRISFYLEIRAILVNTKSPIVIAKHSHLIVPIGKPFLLQSLAIS